MLLTETKMDPLMLHPSVHMIPDYTERLYSLMNLDEILIKEIEEMFSIWDVKRKETEEYTYQHSTEVPTVI